MKNIRTRHSAELKYRVALEAIEKQSTLAEIAHKYKIHPNLVNTWKRDFLEKAKEVFCKKNKNESQSNEKLINQLYEEIGRSKIEIAWLKKKLFS